MSIPSDVTRVLPQACVQWLKKYELTNQEIDELNVCWSEFAGLLIFPMKEDNDIIGYVGRRFKGEGSKYIVKGEKSKFTKIYGKGSSLVFTEDLISAVKVSRVTSALPLFGTYVRSIPQGYDSYYLWLDKDKQISSLQQCKKWKQYGYNIKPIVTSLDPKEYSSHQIQEYLE